MIHQNGLKQRFVLAVGLSLLLLGKLFIAAPGTVRAQLSCSAYNACPAFQAPSGVSEQSPITYWFDSTVDLYLNPDDANDFRNRVRAAVADWVVKTNVSISEGTSGRVKIMISASPSIRIRTDLLRMIQAVKR